MSRTSIHNLCIIVCFIFDINPCFLFACKFTKFTFLFIRKKRLKPLYHKAFRTFYIGVQLRLTVARHKQKRHPIGCLFCLSRPVDSKLLQKRNAFLNRVRTRGKGRCQLASIRSAEAHFRKEMYLPRVQMMFAPCFIESVFWVSFLFMVSCRGTTLQESDPLSYQIN